MESVILERNGDLGAMLIELIDAEVLLHGGDHVAAHHVVPASVKLRLNYKVHRCRRYKYR